MSWILGIVGKRPGTENEKRVRRVLQQAYVLEDRRGFLAGFGSRVRCFPPRVESASAFPVRGARPGVPTGGPSESMQRDTASSVCTTSAISRAGRENARENWNTIAVAGSPIIPGIGRCHIPDEQSVESVFSADPSQIQAAVHGQYALIRANTEMIHIFCDGNRLRSMYLIELDGGAEIVFSTHTRLLAAAVGGLEVNFRTFGSHWLAHNQLSDEALFKGVQRICGPRMVEIRRYSDTAMTCHTSFLEDSNDVSPDLPSASGSPPRSIGGTLVPQPHRAETDPFDTLRSYLFPAGYAVKLALSGGVDSRLLFSLLLEQQDHPWSVFSFGSASDLDVCVARGISEVFGVTHTVVEQSSLVDAAESGHLSRFAADMSCTTPVSAYQRLHCYDQVYADSVTAIVDGAFGEIGRARFYRKIELLRRVRLLRRPTLDDYLKALSMARADLFREDLAAEMSGGMRADVANFVRVLLRQNRRRNEDVMAAHFRRQNFFGYGQAWIDSRGWNVMPFGQNHVISAIVALPVHLRRRGRVYRKHMQQLDKALLRHPFAKGSKLYSYSPWRSRGRTAMNGVIQAGDVSSHPPGEPLLGLRDFVYDLITSSGRSKPACYASPRVRSLADAYYAGDNSRRSELDWFLSFELWRRAHLG